jgi:hypothetical protein
VKAAGRLAAWLRAVRIGGLPTGGETAETTAARRAHAAGDFDEARRILAPTVARGGASLEAIRGLAELEYLLGNYGGAETLLRQVVAASGKDLERRVDAEAALALVYLQTNRYRDARGLFAGIDDGIELPIWELMKSFGDRPPYAIDWPGGGHATVPFTQTTTWELPCVEVEVNGRPLEARIDTGGELFTLSSDAAEALGIEPVVTTTGVFGGGARGEVGYGRVESVRLGELHVRDVPVGIMGLHRPVIGTGFLRQFLSTLDYPGGRLVLRPRRVPREPRDEHGVDVPFALALTHLLVVRGSLNEREGLTFLVDSGLEDDRGAAFAAPADTLADAGIPVPQTARETGEYGPGEVTLEVGRFPIARLGLGPLVERDTLGMYGVFPAEWEQPAEFPIHGLISHNFLRNYRWTLDFAAMTMTFVAPRASS